MSWVELRVHGVSGTPPEDLLARPHVRQVDGDKKSRFFRAVDSDGRILDGDDGHAIEGYHWGKYTSGSWKQSFWLALLPFGLINLAAFMLPAPHGPDGPGSALRGAPQARAVALAALRFLALLLTMLMSFAIALTLISVVSGQWLPTTQAWRNNWVNGNAPVIATVLAGAVMGVLGGASLVARFLKRRGATVGLDQSLHGTPPRSRRTATAPRALDQETNNATPFAWTGFYTGDPDAPTLRGFHVTIGLAMPAFVAATFSGRLAWLPVALIVVAFAATILLGDREGAASTDRGLAEEKNQARGLWHRSAAVLSAVTAAVALVSLLVTAWSMHGYAAVRTAGEKNDRFIPKARTNQFDDRSQQLLYLAAAGLLVLVVAVVALSILTRSTRPPRGTKGGQDNACAWYFRPYSKGCAAIPIAGTAVFLGVGFAAALVVGTTTALQKRTHAKAGSTFEMLERVSYAWALAMLPILTIVAVLLVQKVRSRRALDALADVAYPPGPPEPPFPKSRLEAWRKLLASALWFARAKNAAEYIVWTFFLSGVVLSAAIISEVLRDGKDLPLLGFLSGTGRDGSFSAVLILIGTWVLLGLIGGMVFLARGAFSDANLRRAVNIVWDVVAFWPHAVHPFIPTPYSLRTVGDLAERIRFHADAPVDGRAVVVCGHSQGSLVSFAALSLLSDEECRRVGLLTFGSQLRVIFPRAFPLYVNYDAIARLHDRLDGGWINLYRDTDPLAGPVLSWNHVHVGGGGTSESFPDPGAGPTEDRVVGPHRTRICGDDWRLVDPVPRVDELQEAPVNAVHGHSSYWSSPVWPEALAAVRRSSVR